MGKLKNDLGWYNALESSAAQILVDSYFQHHSPSTYKPVRNKYNVKGERVEECREVTVYTFCVGDVEDPDLYAAQPLCEWEKSDAGQWVMKHAVDVPRWHRLADPMTYGYRYAISARFMGPASTEWLLRNC